MTIDETALERILDALSQHGTHPRRTPSGNYSAKCPAHDGKGNTSLSLRQIEGHALVYCFAGCETADVMAALGLTMADLYDDRHGVRYEYTDDAGRPTRTVFRSPDKQFKQAGETKLKQLYRLPQVLEAVAAGATVYLVEGEKDVHTLVTLGVVATTAPEGAGNFGKCDVSPLKGSNVVAIADRDAAGEKWAERVREKLGGYAASLTVMQAKSGKDITDHVMHGYGLQDLILVAAPGWEVPLPLGWRPDALPAFPVDALPPTIAEYVRHLATATQTPADLPGTVSVGILAACAGGRVEVEARRGWIEPTNLWTVPVLEPGSRKSAVVAACRAPLDEAAANLAEEMTEAIRNSRIEKTVRERHAEKMLTEAAKDADPLSIMAAQEAAAAAEQVQVLSYPRLTISDATPEIMVSRLAEQGGRIAGISAEAGIFDSLTGRYTKTAYLDHVLMAHAGDAIQVDRKGRDPEYIPRPALTLIASIQPYALRAMVERPDFAGRGLLARILWSLAPDIVGHRQIGAPPVPEQVESAYRHLVIHLAVTMARRTAVTCLTLTEPAAKALLDYEAAVEVMLRPNGDLGAPLARQWGSKLVGAVLRIAGCLHVAGGGDITQVDESTIAAAIRLGEYFRQHATAALDAGDDERVAQLRAVLTVLVDKHMATFKVRDLQRRVPRAMQDSAKLTEILDDLAAMGWVRSASSGRYELHPEAARYLKPADSADSADNDDVSAGQSHHSAVSASADNADKLSAQPTNPADSVSTVSKAADNNEGVLSRGNVTPVSAVSAVSTSSLPDEEAVGDIEEWSA